MSCESSCCCFTSSAATSAACSVLVSGVSGQSAQGSPAATQENKALAFARFADGVNVSRHILPPHSSSRAAAAAAHATGTERASRSHRTSQPFSPQTRETDLPGAGSGGGHLAADSVRLSGSDDWRVTRGAGDETRVTAAGEVRRRESRDEGREARREERRETRSEAGARDQRQRPAPPFIPSHSPAVEWRHLASPRLPSPAAQPCFVLFSRLVS